MPRSKHRHKNQKKSVHRPGQAKLPTPARHPVDDPPKLTGDEAVMSEYLSNYLDPFEEEFGGDLAFELLEFVATDAYDADTRSVRPVPRADLIKALTDEALNPPATVEEIDTALAFLAERGLVELAGEEVRVPERYAPKAEGPEADDALGE